ncbi:hypothetical protein M728_005399 (plasmid) [Ensifer sp. WSM1721]|uniref:hypothetical protein n=1 Tax=Ensifer sp. WSM1721 TaxID=1041159 RepID=UPI000478C325|nr:hypothetical protein [Ensifer sp. WSM1721]
MKSLWKYLVQLTSRRRPADVQKSAIEHDTDPAALESEIERLLALPSNLMETSSRQDRSERVPAEQLPMTSDKATGNSDVAPASALPLDVDKTSAPSSDKIHPSASKADVLSPRDEISAKRQSKSRIIRPRRAENGNTQVIAQSAVSKNHDRRLQPSGDAFYGEVTALHAEIKELKSLLARKLHLQNTQIRKMLKRFDVS